MPLRLLHTADWHLGQVLHDHDRGYEHERLLEWLLETVRREEVDVVLVAGDVFDVANPSTDAQGLCYRFLVRAWAVAPHLQVVVIGGNHDSAARLDAVDPFVDALGRIHVVGGVRRTGAGLDLDRMVVPLRDRGGAVRAWVAAVPFLRASETGTGPAEAVARGTRDLYDRVLALARTRREPGQALLAMGHLHLAGGRISERSERRLVVGDLAAVPDELFPPDLAYVALGHLHLAQAVGGRENVRYSGSPLPLALSERGYPHQVVLVDLDGERATPRPLRVPRAVELVQVPADGRPGRAEAVLAELERLPARGGGPEGARPLLEVLVALDGPDPTLAERVAAALEGKEARLARLGRELPGADAGPWGPEPPPIADLTPEQVLVAKHRKDYGGDPSADLLAAFRELVDQVGREPA